MISAMYKPPQKNKNGDEKPELFDILRVLDHLSSRGWEWCYNFPRSAIAVWEETDQDEPKMIDNEEEFIAWLKSVSPKTFGKKEKVE